MLIAIIHNETNHTLIKAGVIIHYVNKGGHVLAIIIDFLVAFLLAKYLQRLSFQIPLAALGGVVSTIIGLITAEIIAGKENVDAVSAILLGILFNPFVTLISLWVFRQKLRTATANQHQHQIINSSK